MDLDIPQLGSVTALLERLVETRVEALVKAAVQLYRQDSLTETAALMRFAEIAALYGLVSELSSSVRQQTRREREHGSV